MLAQESSLYRIEALSPEADKDNQPAGSGFFACGFLFWRLNHDFKKLLINRGRQGQALAELAIFGSAFILILSTVVSYGLRYNYQQKASQEAFRKALGVVVDPEKGSASYQVYHDTHIPDPGDRFGIGSSMLFRSSASVTRDYQTHKTADDQASLPRLLMDVQEKSIKCGSGDGCTNAGFREANAPSIAAVKKYIQIYGNSVTKDNGDSIYDAEDGKINYSGDIRFIDYAAGEIMEYSSAVRQCRQIVDSKACEIECARSKSTGEGESCITICAPDIAAPWYCGDYTEIDSANHRYRFKTLDGLFGIDTTMSNADYKKTHPQPKIIMGLQADYIKRVKSDNQLEKQQAEGQITTTDSLDWQEKIQRQLGYVPLKSNNITYSNVTSEVTIKDVIISKE